MYYYGDTENITAYVSSRKGSSAWDLLSTVDVVACGCDSFALVFNPAMEHMKA